MKKIFFTSIILMLTVMVFGQGNLEEVVYLKNGGITRGVIVEQIPNKTLKIQTRDGNVFVYSFNDIEKITKESPVFANKKEISKDYSKKDVEITQNMRRSKSSGIALTTTAGAFVIIGGSLLGTSGRTYYSSYYGYDSYIDAGSFISGITFLCASFPLLIAGPVMLAKYGRLKNEAESDKGVSFAPSIKTHNFDGISKVPSATSYGMSMRFTF